jgi:hypothetical protein
MGWVYAIGCDGRRLIKIGRTDRDDVTDRLRQLQTGQPDRLTVVYRWATHDSRALEAAMHALLDEHHHRGEWFAITPEQALKAYTAATGDHVVWARVERWVRRRVRAVVRAGRQGCTVVGVCTVAGGVAATLAHLV